jgi:hypothetical protein
MNERRPTPEQLFDALAEQDDDEEQRVSLLSDEALDRELAKAGFDPAVERARGREIGARALRGREPGGAAKPSRRFATGRWVMLIAASLGAFAIAVTRFGPGLLSTNDRVGAPHPDRIVEPAPQAIRRRALDDCDAQRWAPCLEGLDAAQKLDPAGDADERVKRARALAAAHQPMR